MTEAKQKLSALQILRGLAAVWVVIYHLEFLATHYFHTSLGINLIHAGYLGVHLFFVLSGFIIFWIHEADAENANAIRSYYLKRITRIYPLLMVLNVVKLAYMAVSGYGVRPDKFDLSSLLGSFFLVPTTANYLIDVTWSLTYEIWFYLGFGILLLLGRKALYRLGVGYGLLIGALNLPGVPQLEGLARFLFDPRILEFILGCVIAFGLRRQAGTGKTSGFCWLGFALVGMGIGLFSGIAGTLSPLSSCVYWGSVFGGLLLGGLLLERTFDFSKQRLAILVGDASYSIYLAHSLTVNAVAVLFQKLVPAASGPMLWLVLLVCGVSGVASGVACYFGIERPMQNFFRKRIETHRRLAVPVIVQNDKLVSALSPKP